MFNKKVLVPTTFLYIQRGPSLYFLSNNKFRYRYWFHNRKNVSKGLD